MLILLFFKSVGSEQNYGIIGIHLGLIYFQKIKWNKNYKFIFSPIFLNNIFKLWLRHRNFDSNCLIFSVLITEPGKGAIFRTEISVQIGI